MSGGEKMHDWEELASCKDKDPSMFEVPDYKGRLKGGLIRETTLKLAKGKQYCDTCPVSGPCGAEASQEDKKFTTRGGQLPGAYTTMMAGFAHLTKLRK